MLFGGTGNLQVHVGDHADSLANALQGGHCHFHLGHAALGLTMAAVHAVDHFAGAALQAFDHLANFFHGILGAFGQVAHLIGHHSKTAPGFPGAGGFDGGIEGQQVGLLGDRADHFQYRTNLIAATGQAFDLAHGSGHFAGQVLNAQGSGVDHAQPFTGGLVGAASGLGCLCSTAGHVLGGGAHFMEGSRHLIDFAVLLLHTGAGLVGNRRGLVGGAAGILNGVFHVADDRLQLVEKTVEPARQLTQFILLGVSQATGQVAFAGGDVLEHGRHAEDRPGNAAGGQPHQQQAEEHGKQAQYQ